jgi:hypothetical protein
MKAPSETQGAESSGDKRSDRQEAEGGEYAADQGKAQLDGERACVLVRHATALTAGVMGEQLERGSESEPIALGGGNGGHDRMRDRTELVDESAQRVGESLAGVDPSVDFTEGGVERWRRKNAKAFDGQSRRQTGGHRHTEEVDDVR